MKAPVPRYVKPNIWKLNPNFHHRRPYAPLCPRHDLQVANDHRTVFPHVPSIFLWHHTRSELRCRSVRCLWGRPQIRARVRSCAPAEVTNTATLRGCCFVMRLCTGTAVYYYHVPCYTLIASLVRFNSLAHQGLDTRKASSP